jgi:ketosteroid isomerase-like protein
MPSTLPAAVAAYLAAANTYDSRAVADCFTEDAVVQDEGRDWRGTGAIRKWKEETDRKYRPVTDAIETTETDGRTIVTAWVWGNFPWSPIDQRYSFTLDGDKIAALEIR